MTVTSSSSAKSFDVTSTYPSYSTLVKDWDFYLDAYESPVSKYVLKYLIQNKREGDEEFALRRSMAYKENHCRQIINLLNSYLFKDKPNRIKINKNAEKYWGDFEKDCDGKGTSINLFMRNIDKYSSALGRVYIVMDRKTDKPKTGTHLDDLTSQHYMYMVKPQDVIRVAFDDYGNIKWVIIRETYYNDDNPFDAEALTPKLRYRLWTDSHWFLHYEDGSKEMESGAHGVGSCPVFYIDNAPVSGIYSGLSLINEAAYIDKAVFNNISRLSNIIDDQTFSQLVMPVESMVFSDKDAQDEVVVMSTKKVLLFSAQAGDNAKPSYISPDASQAKIILEVIEKQVNQLYNSLGLQSETSTNIGSGDSGSSKEYDYSRLNSYLTSKAERLEELENKIVSTLSKWMATDLEVEIIYPNSFSIKTLQQEILYAQELALLKISSEFQKQINKNVVKQALPKASKEVFKKIEEEIDASTPLDPDGIVDLEKELMEANIEATEANAKASVITAETKTTENPISKAKKDDNGNKNSADRIKENDKGGNLKKEQNKVSNL